MDKEEIVRKVIAMLETDEIAYKAVEAITTPEKLDKTLNILSLSSERALKFLKGAKEKDIFKRHWKIKGMEDVWREWSRKQGIKEGDFLFEN